MRTGFCASLFLLAMANVASAEVAMEGERTVRAVSPFGCARRYRRSGARLLPRPSSSRRGPGSYLRGNGRFGLLYQEQGNEPADVTVSTRLRLDLDISHETDSGVTVGGRVRAQASGGRGPG